MFVGLKFGAALLSWSASSAWKAVGVLVSAVSPFLAVLVLIAWMVALIGKARRRHLLATRSGIDSLRALSWKDFELLVGEALRRDGYTVQETGGGGADGGIDLIARRAHETILVQCKRWKTWSVGVRVVREMFGVMTSEKATGVMIVTIGEFTRSARNFAEGKPVRLVDGQALVALVAAAKSGGFASMTPSCEQPISPPVASPEVSLDSCPKCGASMVVRVARKGPNQGRKFLGCAQFPKCNGTRDLPAG